MSLTISTAQTTLTLPEGLTAVQANRVAIDTFLDQYTSINSRQAYERALKRIARLAGNDDIYRVPYILADYRAALQIKNALLDSRKYAATTINHTLTTLRGMAETLFKLGYITADQCKRIQAVENVKERRESNPYDFIQEGDIDRLYVHVQELGTVAGQRNVAILAVLQHGLRVTEVVSLRLDSYNRISQTLTFTGKGNKERTVPLKPFAADMINDWLTIRGKEPGALFCALAPLVSTLLPSQHLARQTINYMLHKYAKEVGLGHITPHDFRRFFVSVLLENGYDYGQIKEFTGHADIRTVARYDVRSKKQLFERFQNEAEF